MKMQTINSNTKRFLNIFFVSALLLSTSLATRANGGNQNGGDGDKTAEVKYVGSLDGEGIFNVLYTNITGARFSIKVEDREGNQIFQSSFTDKKFDKKFRLEGSDTDKLVFTITNYGDNSTQVFEVNTRTRLVEDVEVKELN